MARRQHFIPCLLKQLPVALHAPASEKAIDVNPLNRPDEKCPPDRIAARTRKYWGPKGVDLSVSFLEQTTPDLRTKILAHMNAWNTEADANVNFGWTAGTGQIRITRESGGYASYVGTDSLQIATGQPTMWLEGFNVRTPESEYRRVVRHETGHVLGFVHEHMRRELVALLDPDKTIAYFLQFQGWDRTTTIQQVLTPIEESALFEATRVDGTSIMAYHLPAEITRNGQPIPGGIDLDAVDKEYAKKLYPKPTPVVLVPGGPEFSVLVLLDKDGKEVLRRKLSP